MILPNFFIIGARKAGTTALCNYVMQHPDICFSKPKETDYFNRHYGKGIDWFSSHFNHYKGETAVGEGSTGLLSSIEAPSRIAKHIPKAKIICLLRDPVTRAFSHYYYYIYTGKEDSTRSFSEVIRDEKSHFGQQIIDMGKYVEHLSRYDEQFGRSQMKIILQDSFRKETEKEIKQIFKFLNIDDSFIPNADNDHNKTVYPKSRKVYSIIRGGWKIVQDRIEVRFPNLTNKLRAGTRSLIFDSNKPRMEEEDRKYLKKIYKPYNKRLEDWVQLDLSHWN